MLGGLDMKIGKSKSMEALGFRWVDIARMLGMSPRTLTRRTQEFGMPLGQQHKYFPTCPTLTWTIL